MSDEYSEAESKAVLAMVDDWYEAFAKSAEFASLSDSQQRKAGAITECFARHAYEYLLVTPAKWDRDAIEECCLEILPRKVSAVGSFFEAIAAVLSAFFNFLGNQSLLRDGHVLAEAVEDLDDEIAANSEERSNWGPAKHFVMAAHKAGVDIQDPDALRALMLQVNLQHFARSGYARATGSSGADPHATGPEQFLPPANRYDPCPCGSGKKYKFCCEQKR